MAERGYVDDPEESARAGRKVFIKLPYGRCSPRRFTRHNRRKKLITYASYLWEKEHANDPILPDENIHHKDLNSMNDDIGNLVKMTKADHQLLHEKLIKEKIQNEQISLSILQKQGLLPRSLSHSHVTAQRSNVCVAI